MGETGDTEAKRVSRRVEWSEVLDATGQPRKLVQKRDIGPDEEVFGSDQLQGKMETAASLQWIEGSVAGEILV